MAGRDAPVLDPKQRALVELALVQPEANRPLEHLEGVARRREEELLAGGADPERAAAGAGQEDGLRDALVDPRRGHRTVQLLERLRMRLGMLGEREDRLGVDRHLRMSPVEAVAGEDL